MEITRISVFRLPGIDQPFEVAPITPGFNIIQGPNGSGKTSLCRSVRLTLWPVRGPGGTRVRISWLDDRSKLTSELEGGVSWQREGEDISAPEFPPAHLDRCYTISLRDLLEEEHSTDLKLADEIRIKMAGGYDLPAVRELFRLKSSHGQKEAGALAAAEGNFDRLRNERRGLADEEDRLESLQKKRESARAADLEREVLQKAHELALKKEEAAGLQAILDGFPEGMEKIRGDEEERIGEIEAEIAQLEDDVTGYRRGIEEAETDLAAVKLPEGPVDEGGLETWDERVRMLADLARERADREKDRDRFRKLEEAAAKNLGAVNAESAPADLDGRTLARVDAWFRKAIRARTRREELEAKMAGLTPEEAIDPAGIDQLRRAVDLLRDWLSSPAARRPAGGRHRLLIAGAVVAVLAGIGLGLFVTPWFFLLGGLGLGLLAGRLAGPGGGDELQETLRKRYQELGRARPATWRRGEVSRLLQTLEAELRQKERDRDDVAVRVRVRSDLAVLAVEEEVLGKERKEICRDAGIDPGVCEMEITDFIDRLRTFREASRQRAGAEAEYDGITVRDRAELEKVRAFLGRKLGETPGDSIEARSLLALLKNRSDRIRNAEYRIENSEKEIAAREETLRKKRARIRDIFKNAGIDPADPEDARRRLAERLGRLEEFREENRRLLILRNAVAELSAGLREHPALLELAPPRIKSILETAIEKAGELESIVGEIQQVRDRVRTARRGDDIERSLEEIEAASVQLEEKYEELLASAGELLLARVEEEYEEKSRPAVLARAARWFSAFTRARYDLLVGGEPSTPSFRARDTSTGRGIGLAELSDGTRVQLLLAARLAFATQAEAGKALPVFLDEALTTSDPERFRAITESLLILAGEGRQIFYLTANPSDAAFFAAIFREQEKAAPNLLDLGEIRKLALAAESPGRLTPDGPQPVPAPEGMTAEAYGRCLGVPPLDPAGPAGSAHLFYLLYDKLPLLYTIITNTGINTVGQWRSFTRFNRMPPGIDPEERDLLDARTALLDLFLEQRSIGRGRLLDRETLQESGAVSDRYLDAFAELAREMGNDALTFIQTLEAGDDPRTTGFLKKKKESLRAFLEENECIDRRERLTREEITALAMTRSDLRAGLSAEEIVKRISAWWNSLAEATAVERISER